MLLMLDVLSHVRVSSRHIVRVWQGPEAASGVQCADCQLDASHYSSRCAIARLSAMPARVGFTEPFQHQRRKSCLSKSSWQVEEGGELVNRVGLTVQYFLCSRVTRLCGGTPSSRLRMCLHIDM